MSLATTQARYTYAGDAVTQNFAFPELFVNSTDLKVILSITANTVDQPQTIATHYTVTGAGNPAGGSIHMLAPPPVGAVLYIYRDPPQVQALDLIAGGELPSASLEAAFDLLTMEVQALRNEVKRCMRVPISGNEYVPVDRATRIGKTVKFDGAGNFTLV